MSQLKINLVNDCLAVSAEEIIRVEAFSNYSRIYFSNGKKILVAKVLRWFEDELPVEIFARVHRSHLVNKLFVEKIKGNRSKILLLNNGEMIAVSKREKSICKNAFAVLYNT